MIDIGTKNNKDSYRTIDDNARKTNNSLPRKRRAFEKSRLQTSVDDIQGKTKSK